MDSTVATDSFDSAVSAINEAADRIAKVIQVSRRQGPLPSKHCGLMLAVQATLQFLLDTPDLTEKELRAATRIIDYGTGVMLTGLQTPDRAI